MKKFNILTMALAIAIMVISACSTTNKVTSDNLIQKRKYRPGYYVQSPFQYTKKEKTEVKETLNKANEFKNESETISNSEITNNEVLIASVNDNPKNIVQANNISTNLIELYHSDVKDIKTFRKEYIKLKKGAYANLICESIKKRELIQTPSPLKHVGGGFSIASFVLGIIGLITQGYICGVLAIVFGIIGLVRGRRKGLAVFGLIFGILDIIGASLAITLFMP